MRICIGVCRLVEPTAGGPQCLEKIRRTVRAMGCMATDVVGAQPTVTHYHNPPILMADVT